MELKVRIAGQADAGLIAEMSRSTFYETFASSNSKEDMDKFMNEQFTKEALMNEVLNGQNIFILAEDGIQALGYARMRETENPPELGSHPAIEIARIYATANAIGKGVGKVLMQKCIAIAGELNKKVIWLGVWERNDRAIEFYKKWGFEKFGEHPFLLGSDLQTDWLMKKTLL